MTLSTRPFSRIYERAYTSCSPLN